MARTYTRAACWIRRDLRLSDHTALAAALAQSESGAVLFVFDPVILDALADRDDRRLTFIHDSLREIDDRLREGGSKLVVLFGDPKVEIPKFARQFDVEAIFTSEDYEPYARHRDEAVKNSVSVLGCELLALKDQVIFSPSEVLSGAGDPFRVYTPYAKAWRSKLNPKVDLVEHRPDLRQLWPADGLAKANGLDAFPLDKLGFDRTELWVEPGEAAACRQVEQFGPRMGSYAENRDYPFRDGTSVLSPHLRFGTISVRECFRQALARGPSADKWVAELIWREFYQHILGNFPNVVDEPFQEKYRELQYPGSDEDFERWTLGQTGYPIVDAAMRCLNETGWMHNRLRMVVASFLTKDLLVDYRKGEAYFARKLLDFDLASNNGGWQWAASTGCDPQPYFRIFNPVLQSLKFDSDGNFIRRYVPELAALRGEAIHWPSGTSTFDLLSAGVELGVNYPKPIVDHAVQREQAIAMMKNPHQILTNFGNNGEDAVTGRRG